jgi:hypothetical protein
MIIFFVQSYLVLEPFKRHSNRNGSFDIDDLMNQVMDFENGAEERSIDPESYLYLTALITPILGVNPQCYNDSLTYVRALNNLTSPDFMWALKSKLSSRFHFVMLTVVGKVKNLNSKII